MRCVFDVIPWLQERNSELWAHNEQLVADLKHAQKALAASQDENKLLAQHLEAALASAAKLR